jgi:nucleotide-binding universal stress UspA family protein
MSYRTILVPVGQPDNAQSAVTAAFLVARRFAGHVRGVHVLPDLTNPATHALVASRMTAEEAQSDFRRFRASAELVLQREATELKRLFDEAASRAGAAEQAQPAAANRLSASWEAATGFESEVVGRLGRIFDLTVIARRGPRGSSHDTVQAGLLDTGRPLVLAPPAVPAALGDSVLLAWNASPQAARAVASALPFLRHAARVTIMTVGNGPEPEPTADQLARSLAWHGVAAEVRHIEQGSHRVRDILLSEARTMAADLLVIGAYSHSRMRQVVFGGVTEHMLDHAELPVLMTH